jgi:hypothetical protein
MGVGCLLATLDDAGPSLVFRDRRRSQLSILIEGEESDRTSSVLSGEKEFSGRVNRDMSSPSIATGNMVEEFEGAVFLDPIGGSPSFLVHRGGGVEQFSVGMEGEKSGALDLGGKLGGGQLACFRVKGSLVDPFGPLSSGAKIDMQRFRLEGNCEGEGAEAEKETGE